MVRVNYTLVYHDGSEFDREADFLNERVAEYAIGLWNTSTRFWTCICNSVVPISSSENLHPINYTRNWR